MVRRSRPSGCADVDAGPGPTHEGAQPTSFYACPRRRCSADDPSRILFDAPRSDFAAWARADEEDRLARWLFKEEPGHYSFADLVRDRKAVWSGVSNAL